MNKHFKKVLIGLALSAVIASPAFVSAQTTAETIASIRAEIDRLTAQLETLVAQMGGSGGGSSSTSFANGDRVRALATLNVRSAPSTGASVVTTLQPGSTGTVRCNLATSPCPASANSHTWWYIVWDSSSGSGYSAEGPNNSFIAKISSTTDLTDQQNPNLLSGTANTSSEAGGPIITSISPTSGPVGTIVTVTGSNFALVGNKLNFGNLVMVPSYNVVSPSGNVMKFVVPAGPTLAPPATVPIPNPAIAILKAFSGGLSMEQSSDIQQEIAGLPLTVMPTPNDPSGIATIVTAFTGTCQSATQIANGTSAICMQNLTNTLDAIYKDIQARVLAYPNPQVSPGTYNVSFTKQITSAQTATSNSVQFTVTPPAPIPGAISLGASNSYPMLFSISPTSGPVGTLIKLTGSGFAPTNNITSFGVQEFFGVPSSDNGTTLYVTVPSSLTASCSTFGSVFGVASGGCSTQSTNVNAGTQYSVNARNATGVTQFQYFQVTPGAAVTTQTPPPPTPTVGNGRIQATLDGQAWSGPLTGVQYSAPYGSGVSSINVPANYPNQPLGNYSFTPTVPPGYQLASITVTNGSSCGTGCGVLTSANSTSNPLTFTFNFVTSAAQATTGYGKIQATLNGNPWPGQVTLQYGAPYGAGQATVTLPVDYPNQPLGNYSFNYVSGGPGTISSIIISNGASCGSACGILTANNTVNNPLTFTLSFTTSAGGAMGNMAGQSLANVYAALQFQLNLLKEAIGKLGN